MSAMNGRTTLPTAGHEAAGDDARPGRDHLIRYGGEFSDLLIERAEGSWLTTEDGRRILDFTSGQMCATLGHGHPAILEAMREASGRVVHLFSGFLSRDVTELARELMAVLPAPLARAMFLSTGGEANEAALRLAKLHTGGHEVLAFAGSWHGMTAGAASSTYSAGRRGYGPGLPGTMALPTPNAYRCPIAHCRERCDLTCLNAGMALADAQSVGAPAAAIVEPILSAGGIVPLPEGYMAALKQRCEDRGMLLVVDEAQTAMGRVGTMFAFEQHDVVPDFVTLSKTLGGGLPLSATVTTDAIEQDAFDKGFLHVTSHVSDPLPAAVGRAVLSTVIAEDLGSRAVAIGARLRAGPGGAPAPPRGHRRRPRRRPHARGRPRQRPRDPRARHALRLGGHRTLHRARPQRQHRQVRRAGQRAAHRPTADHLRRGHRPRPGDPRPGAHRLSLRRRSLTRTLVFLTSAGPPPARMVARAATRTLRRLRTRAEPFLFRRTTSLALAPGAIVVLKRADAGGMCRGRAGSRRRDGQRDGGMAAPAAGRARRAQAGVEQQRAPGRDEPAAADEGERRSGDGARRGDDEGRGGRGGGVDVLGRALVRGGIGGRPRVRRRRGGRAVQRHAVEPFAGAPAPEAVPALDVVAGEHAPVLAHPERAAVGIEGGVAQARVEGRGRRSHAARRRRRRRAIRRCRRSRRPGHWVGPAGRRTGARARERGLLGIRAHVVALDLVAAVEVVVDRASVGRQIDARDGAAVGAAGGVDVVAVAAGGR